MGPEPTHSHRTQAASPTPHTGKKSSHGPRFIIHWSHSPVYSSEHCKHLKRCSFLLRILDVWKPLGLSLVDEEILTPPQPEVPAASQIWSQHLKNTTVIQPALLLLPHFLLFSVQDAFQMWRRAQSFGRPRKWVWCWALTPKSQLCSYFPSV